MMKVKVLYIVFAGIYILLRQLQVDGIFPVVIKVIPILILFSFALNIKAETQRMDKLFLILALLFSLIGDAVLSLKASWFIFGLAAFLVAHLFYIPLFCRHFSFQSSKLLIPIAVLLYAGSMGWILKDINPKLLVPVYGYLSVISVMVITSIFNRFHSKTLIVGTLLFMISDSLIAVNKFLAPVPLSGLFIMSTYYTAQFLITNTFVSELNKGG